MFFTLSKIAEFFIAPTHAALFVAALGAALLFTRFARGGRLLASIGVVALLLMAFSPLGAFLTVPLENRFPTPPDDMEPPDGIIVLGGSVDEHVSRMRGQAALHDAAERLTTPLELLRRYPRARLVFTGGSAALLGSPFSEAEAARRFWRDMGVEEGRALYESRSRNTWENALFTRDLIAPGPSERWLLVTSASHMPRAMGIFRKVGFPVIAYPVDFRTTGVWFEGSLHPKAPERMGLVDLAAHEWIGLLAYRLTGKIDSIFPSP